MKLIRLGLNESAKLRIDPTRSFDVGKGKGVQLDTTVQGGTVGIIFDCRGRPLDISEDPPTRIRLLKEWMTELDVYPVKALEG